MPSGEKDTVPASGCSSEKQIAPRARPAPLEGGRGDGSRWTGLVAALQQAGVRRVGGSVIARMPEVAALLRGRAAPASGEGAEGHAGKEWRARMTTSAVPPVGSESTRVGAAEQQSRAQSGERDYIDAEQARPSDAPRDAQSLEASVMWLRMPTALAKSVIVALAEAKRIRSFVRGGTFVGLVASRDTARALYEVASDAGSSADPGYHRMLASLLNDCGVELPNELRRYLSPREPDDRAQL